MAQTPQEKARARLLAQVLGAAAAAEAAGKHEGDWRLHHVALPAGPGDFTPYPVPEYAEEELSPLGQLLERLAEALGPDYARAIAQRGLEAGQ
jgi:hypothetical protein